MAERDRFVVSALKFRPQTFAEVTGQEHISTTLSNAIRRNRLANAYLFCGPRGVGKTSTARILAKAMNCTNPSGGEPCNDCESCKAITAGRSMDVIELDAASNRGIDEARELRENVRFPPAMSRYKVYIIDEAHQLTKDAFNALLKTLEEPPPHAKFILATTEADKMLDTIVSRCQQYRFRPLSLEQIVTNLRRCLETQPAKLIPEALVEETLYLIARASDGGMRDAQSLFDQVASLADESLTLEEIELVLGGVRFDSLLQLTEAIRSRNTLAALDLIHSVQNRGQDMGLLVRDLLGHFRNLMVIRSAPGHPELLGLPPDQVRAIGEQAASLAMEDLLQGLDILFEAERRLKVTGQPRAVCEAAVIKLAKMPTTVEIEALLGQGGAPPLASGASPARASASAPPPSAQYRRTMPAAQATQPRADPQPPASPRNETMSQGARFPSPSGPAVAVLEAEPSVGARDALAPRGTAHSPAALIQMDEEPDREVLETLLDRWGEICHKVTERDVRYGGFLSDAVPTSNRSGRIDLLLPSDLEYHISQLGSRKAKQILKEVFWSEVGAELEIEVRGVAREELPAHRPVGIEAEAPPSSKQFTVDEVIEAEPSIKTILEQFDGVVVEIRNNPNR